MKIKRFVLSVIVGCGILVGTGWTQQFPATINIPVTFYDFHSDKTNPEFEQPHFSGVHLGMVANFLDAERKPVLGPAPYRNYYIKKWFRPWQPGDFTITSYTVLSGGELNAVLQFNGIVTVGYDTAFKNVVIPMNLPFTYIPGSTGMYQYNNQNFFLLDGLGFGNEGLAHNFSFTMELHTDFTYNQGLIFNFEGDDDVWMFINNSLRLDLGGIHPTAAGSINLDTLTGMQIGKKYSFDLFYAERHTTSSDIRITTNLFTPPGYLQLFSKPDAPGPANPRLGPLDTAIAGQNFTLYAHVFDSLYNWVSSNDNLVTWTVTDTLGNQLQATTQGSFIIFTPQEEQTKIFITATFKDLIYTLKTLTTSVVVVIKKDSTSSRLEFLSISKAREKAKITHEYYNLRGQKLSHYGIRHADGIVLERVIEPAGKVSVRKKLIP
jgi:fibro-slime domain-containing protein